MNEQKVLVVGRHKFDAKAAGFEGAQIERESIQFPATSQECIKVLEELIERGFYQIIFQGLPGQVSVAIAHMMEMGKISNAHVGVVISKPAPRPEGKSRLFTPYDIEDIDVVESAVRFANPRAEVSYGNTYGSGITVTVDPPMRFEFSHIEWFN